MNPLIRRGIRERLRPKNLVASGLFSIIACATLYLASFFDGMQEIIPASELESGLAELISMPVNGAREAFTVLLVLQGFFLMFLGTGRVASVTAEEKEAGLLDYQRMTPMNPFSKILGYLFGLPAREYFMFLLTLPFLLHCMVVGKIPLLNLFQLYAVFFCSVILYHLTAHVIGLVVPKPRAASWVARLAVLGLYVFLPVLGQAGISFLSFLTILPTYFGKIVPHLLAEGNQTLGRFERHLSHGLPQHNVVAIGCDDDGNLGHAFSTSPTLLGLPVNVTIPEAIECKSGVSGESTFMPTALPLG